MKKRRHFKVSERRAFNGADQATITIYLAGGGAIFSVRPHRRRKTYELPLSDVARIVIVRVVMAEQREKRERRRVNRGQQRGRR